MSPSGPKRTSPSSAPGLGTRAKLRESVALWRAYRSADRARIAVELALGTIDEYDELVSTWDGRCASAACSRSGSAPGR